MLGINNDILKGLAIGVGVSAVAFYVYKKNEVKVDGFLREHGIDVEGDEKSLGDMSLVDLMKAKETIEDLIAEKELENEEVIVENEEVNDDVVNA